MWIRGSPSSSISERLWPKAKERKGREGGKEEREGRKGREEGKGRKEGREGRKEGSG